MKIYRLIHKLHHNSNTFENKIKTKVSEEIAIRKAAWAGFTSYWKELNKDGKFKK